MELMNNATVIGGGTLSIDQLLRAAQLLEQQSTAFKLAASAEHQHHHQQQQQQQSVVVQEHFQQQINGGLFGKLGEKYQERYVMSKIRPVHLEQPVAASAFHPHHHHHGYSSTGSSRRSTPTSSIFSASASASNCSSPNSPAAATTSAAAAPLAANPAAAANISQQLLFAQPPQQTFVTTGVNQPQQIPAPTCSISSSSSLISAVLQSPSSSFASTSTFIPSASASPQTITETGNGAVSFNVRQSRAAHNELEKNRRANLRGYLDKLKSVLPPDTDSTRDTTLSLLTRARNHIRTVKQEKNVLMERRNALFTEHLRLRQQLDALNASAASECAQRSSAAQAQCQQEQKPQPVETEMLEPQIAKEQHNGESASSTTALHCQEKQQEQPYVSAFTPVVAGSNNGCAEQQRQQQEESAFPISKPSPLKTTAVDLYMDGLLPALPLLYPYTDLVARHALVSNMLIAAANAAVSVKNPLSS